MRITNQNWWWGRAASKAAELSKCNPQPLYVVQDDEDKEFGEGDWIITDEKELFDSAYNRMKFINGVRC